MEEDAAMEWLSDGVSGARPAAKAEARADRNQAQHATGAEWAIRKGPRGFRVVKNAEETIRDLDEAIELELRGHRDQHHTMRQASKFRMINPGRLAPEITFFFLQEYNTNAHGTRN